MKSLIGTRWRMSAASLFAAGRFVTIDEELPGDRFKVSYSFDDDAPISLTVSAVDLNLPRATARDTDPDTSHDAIDHVDVTGDRALVLATHYANPAGLTDFELAETCQRKQTSLGKRRGELVDGGYLVDAGHKRPVNPDEPNGPLARVWCITGLGVRTAEQLPTVSRKDIA